jgi:hypothetical protein
MMNMSSQGGGHLYMQTNEIRNCVVHYRRAADGAINRNGTYRYRRRRFGNLQAD